jgi:DNA-binding protein Fis
MRLGEVERELVQQALHATNGNQVRAARILGISRDALRTRMKKFGFL